MSNRYKSILVCVATLVGCLGLPIIGVAQSADEETKGKSITWSGLEWKVKSSLKRVGPGPNYFSRENVWIDTQGRLHLKVSSSKDGDGNLRWHCAEVVSQLSFGYGTYRWYLDTAIKQDPNIVLGLFTWDNTSSEDHHREIDIELISTWGSKDSDQNAQYVVQPWTTKANRHRYHLASEPSTTTHIFTWKTNSVDFLTLAGHGREPGQVSSVLHEWTYTGPDIPRAGAENARMNLWLLKRPTEDAKETEVIISKFEFDPEGGDAKSRSPVFTIELTSIPPASLKPGPVGLGSISGKVAGMNVTDCKVIVYARGGDTWYAQPLADSPDTSVSANGTWTAKTHGGDEYGVLLVKKSYKAAARLAGLPEIGGDVLAVARKKPE